MATGSLQYLLKFDQIARCSDRASIKLAADRHLELLQILHWRATWQVANRGRALIAITVSCNVRFNKVKLILFELAAAANSSAAFSLCGRSCHGRLALAESLSPKMPWGCIRMNFSVRPLFEKLGNRDTVRDCDESNHCHTMSSSVSSVSPPQQQFFCDFHQTHTQASSSLFPNNRERQFGSIR
jgi:hypothetical protein